MDIAGATKDLRPGEKAVGYLFSAFLLGGLGWGLSLALPALLAFAWGLVSLSVAGGILFVLGFMATDDRTRNLASLVYRSLIRNVSKAFIRMDPISVAKDYVIMLKKKLQLATKKLGELVGVMKSMRDTIDTLKKEFTESARMARAADQVGDKKTKIIQGSKATATAEAVEDLEVRYARLVKCKEMIEKLIENDDLVIQVTENNVRILNIRFGAAQAAGDAFDAAYAIAQQDPERREQYDTACEEATKIISERMGMMDLLVDSTSGVIRNIDVKNAMIDNNALADLEAFEQRLFATKPARIGEAAPPADDALVRAFQSQNHTQKTL